MDSQNEIRRRILAARDQLSPVERAEKSMAITANLLAVPRFTHCRCAMFYASFRSEVSTGAAIAACLVRDMAVALPLALPAAHRLQPRLVSDPTRQLSSGYWGIPEPDPELTSLLSPGEIEAVIVPGSVFDLQGGRIGYGGGFYDRFLQQEAPQALRIGLAYTIQILADNLPLAVHDQRLDVLVTEAEVYHFPAR